MVEVATGRRAAAAGTGARGVPDLGQVPERDAGVLALGLVAVITVLRRNRADIQEQVPLAGAGASGSCVPSGL
jgi:hypothetical protein